MRQNTQNEFEGGVATWGFLTGESVVLFFGDDDSALVLPDADDDRGGECRRWCMDGPSDDRVLDLS